MKRAEIRTPYLDPSLPELLKRLPEPRRALFLDRDGVININHGYVHQVEQTEWIAGIFDLVSMAHTKGLLPVVVTNQAGIGRGYYSEETFMEYTRWVHSQFRDRRAPIAATYYCPHHLDAVIPEFQIACDCRKPAPGMIKRAIVDLDIDAQSSIMVGDNLSDLLAAKSSEVGLRILFGQEDAGVSEHAVADLKSVIEYL